MASEIKPVIEWPDYATDPTGGDPFTQDLNAPYDKVHQLELWWGRKDKADENTGRLVLASCVHCTLLVSQLLN